MKVRFPIILLWFAVLALPYPVLGQSGDGATSIRVAGHVSNGTSGAQLPTALRLRLTVTGFDESQSVSTDPKQIAVRDADMAADGTFAFDKVPAQLGYTYTVSTRYAGGLQNSVPVTLKNASAELTVPFTVYEATSDSALVQVQHLTMRLDFAKIPGAVQIEATYEFSVTGDRMYLSGDKTPTGDSVSVMLPLLPQAQSVSALARADQPRIAISAAAVQDTLPIRPGEVHLVAFRYALPYKDAVTFAQTLPYAVADTQVFIPLTEKQITFMGEGFDPGEKSSVGGVAANLYWLMAPIAKGGLLKFDIKGLPSNPAPLAEPTRPDSLLPFVILAIGLVFVGAGSLFLLRRRARHA